MKVRVARKATAARIAHPRAAVPRVLDCALPSVGAISALGPRQDRGLAAPRVFLATCSPGPPAARFLNTLPQPPVPRPSRPSLPPPPPVHLPRQQPSGSKFTSVATISYAEDMNPRYRSTMEDACSVVDGFGGDGGTGYFGIYDGHGGRNVAEFVRLHLHVNVEKELRVKGERSVEECLKAAFSITDMEASLTGEQASGSTAAVCVVRRQGPKRYVYSANCGDARAVLCHAGVAVRLSKDHKATDAQERVRIEAAGGFVVRKRVMGVLAVARAFGDFVLKKFVTAEPYTSTTKLDVMSHFIIIACDGVWDVLEDQEAVDLVVKHLGGVGAGAAGGGFDTAKAKTAAQVLVDTSLAKGSTDNVTALVVFL